MGKDLVRALGRDPEITYQEDLSIHPTKGIKDFGVATDADKKDTGKGRYSPLDLVKAVRKLDLAGAFDWLEERLRGPDPAGGGDGVPFLITAEMKAALAGYGFTPEQIREMKPEEAWEKLRANGWTPAAKSKPEESAPPPQEDKKKAALRVRMLELVSNAAVLQHRKFPPHHYVVPELVPEGVTLFAGKPKVGKSFSCLDFAIGVATGGMSFGQQCEEGDVLALFLEDTDRRMQRRLDRMMGTTKAPWPARLRYATQFPRLNEGGLEMLQLWACETEKPRLIIIDLWERFRPLDQGKGNDNRYASDYRHLAQLQQAMSVFPQLAIIVTNHQRKLGSDDIFDTISGTLGLNGGADTLMVLAREEGAKTLEIRGRDLADHAIVVEQDAIDLRWRSLGLKAAGASTPERKQIVEAMRGRGVMSVKKIAESIGRERDYDAVKHLLYKMLNDGVVEQGAQRRGTYRLTERPNNGEGDGC
jgi:hypothetical protein